MKLFKKFLPIATVAATASIVAPMITSCSQNIVFSTTDINWQVTDIHPEATIETQDQYNDLFKEYFNTNKHFLDDLANDLFEDEYGPKQAVENLEHQKSIGTITDYKMDFSLTISDLSYTPKTLNIGKTYGEVNGCVISYTVSQIINYQTTGKVINDQRTDEICKDMQTTSVNNSFVVIQPLKTPTITLLFHKDLDWKENHKEKTNVLAKLIKDSTNAVLDEKSTTYESDETRYKNRYTYTEDIPYAPQETENIDSQYLSKITFAI